jgi:Phytanoyl-CoA dioxygenase (PhyH)
MMRRLGGNVGVFQGEASPATQQLARDGYVVVRDVFTSHELEDLRAEVARLFAALPPGRGRPPEQYRYGGLNHSAAVQQAIGHPTILATIEPLLGDDCHVIANTLWNNPPEFAGGPWHCDAGPHVPRPEGVPWDDRIPYPVFAIGAHLYLRDCHAEDGPTAAIPGSNRSGRLPPLGRITDSSLTYEGRSAQLLEANAGDVAFFVSDTWHRGMPAGPDGRGRLFVQAHYGRRDIAQRLATTADSHQLSQAAIERANDPRQRKLLGLHDPYFYDG